jgi:hypothetical protein
MRQSSRTLSDGQKNILAYGQHFLNVNVKVAKANATLVDGILPAGTIVDKDGKRYLVIPFRYGSPGSKFRSMPEEVYKKARELEQSQIVGKYREGVQQGAKSFEQAQLQRKFNSVKVQRNAYKYGEQLSGLEEKYKHYEGIFRFENNPNLNRSEISTGKFVNSTDSEQQYSTYIKFAVMREDDSGWQHPGLKPMNILGETVERERANILNLIRSGLLKDMQALGFQTC